MNSLTKLSLSAIVWVAVCLTDECQAAERPSFIRPVQGQTIEYERGDAFVTSVHEISTVVFAPRFESKTLAILYFTIFNAGAESITVLESAVVARVDGQIAKVLGREALAKMEKRKRVFENIMTGLAAGANAYAGAQQQTTTSNSTHRGQVSNAYGAPVAHYSGYSTTTSVDTLATEQRRQEAAERNARMISSVQANQAARQAVLDQSVLATQTVRPGQSYSGLVKLKLPRTKRDAPTEVDVAISFGERPHVFRLTLDKPGENRLGELHEIARAHPGTHITPQMRIPPPTGEGSVRASAPVIVEKPVHATAVVPEPATVPAEGAANKKRVTMVTTAFMPTIRGISIRSVMADGADRTYVFFDIDWTKGPITPARRFRGNLILADEMNVDRLSMPWPIEWADASRASFSEREVGFAIDDLGGAGEWLRTTAPSDIGARYEVPNPSSG